MKELTFPLERSPSMKLLGIFWTGSISGQILVGFLLFIGLFFMGNEHFNLLSISFFIGFILPISFLLHKRLVRKGKKLMKPWCEIQYVKDTLTYKTGFPNTMNPDWQELKITKENNSIIIIGSEVGGYHLRLSGKADPPVRLGLWSQLDQARKSAKKLQSLLGGDLDEKLRPSHSSDL
ncbi:MAG: hypothetical protein ACXAB7_07580 [Candidatus Kariarchaeaceae archaeon]|jgi:hypothetical protein